MPQKNCEKYAPVYPSYIVKRDKGTYDNKF